MNRRRFLSVSSWAPLAAGVASASPREDWPRWSGWSRPPNQAVEFGFWFAPTEDGGMLLATVGGLSYESHSMTDVVMSNFIEGWPCVHPGDDLSVPQSRARELFRKRWGF